MEKVVEGLVWYVAFLFSVVFHEAAHAWAALKLGDPTAYHGGQVSLDPRPHIKQEPIGMVVFPIIAFILGGWMMGWASTPYDPYWARRHPSRSALMSLAGPLSNLALVILSGIIIRMGLKLGLVLPESFFSALMFFIKILFTLNLILFVFNLLPLPPMDGSNAVILLLSDDTAQKYMDFLQNPMYRLIGLFIAWKLFGYVFDPFYAFALKLLFGV